MDGPGHHGRMDRTAVTAVFFLTGAVSGTWAARVPAIQEQLSLSPGELALAVLAIEAGAVAGLPLGAAAVARLGERRSLRAGFAVFPAALVLATLAPGLGWLALALMVWAGANSVIDVAMNAAGVRLEHARERPLLSGMHAAHSFGVLAGGLLAVAAVRAGVDLTLHAALVAAPALAAGLAAPRWIPSAGERQSVFARPDRAAALLCAMAFCAFLCEGAATNWSAVSLRSEHGAAPALATAGFTAFALALAVARLAGDRLVRRFGRARVVRLSAALAAGGALLAIAAPTAPLAVLGWAVVGAGLAPLAPALIGAAPGVTGAPAGVAIAAVTTIGYLGSFTGPPLIGAVAEATDLSAALGLLAVAAAVTAVVAPRALSARVAPTPSPAATGG